MSNPLYGRHFLAIEDFTQSELELILEVAAQFKRQPPATALLQQQIVASCFFEPSTRTRLSFESAVMRLGGAVIGFADGNNSSSQQKGESLTDSIQAISYYADAIILRHPQINAAQLAASASRGIPVINAGDGTHHHPTQALLDLLTIQETQQRIEDLDIAMVGDLKHGRTVHSLTQALAKFSGNRLFFVSSEALAMPPTLLYQLEKQGVMYSLHRHLQEVIQQVDILYMTRLQRERFEATEYLGADQPLILDAAKLRGVRPHLKVLHPLPRLVEVHPEVDDTPYACYFQQVANGLYARQALLALLLRAELPLSNAL